MKSPAAECLKLFASLAFASFLWFTACSSWAQARTNDYSAESVKAAFLYHFGTYVDWPQGVDSDVPFTIGVMGAKGVAAELRRVLRGRTIQNRPLRVRELSASDDLSNLQMIYVGPSVTAGLPQLVKAAQQHRTLVVSDTEKGLEKGAMINFVELDRRIKFEISVPAAEQAGLKLSSRLLSVALRVKLSHWTHPTAIASARPFHPGA